jgi:hypothetical protein
MRNSKTQEDFSKYTYEDLDMNMKYGEDFYEEQRYCYKL